jgi:hypothetical protein
VREELNVCIICNEMNFKFHSFFNFLLSNLEEFDEFLELGKIFSNLNVQFFKLYVQNIQLIFYFLSFKF